MQPFTLKGKAPQRFLEFEQVIGMMGGERTLTFTIVEGDNTFQPILNVMERCQALEEESAGLKAELAKRKKG